MKDTTRKSRITLWASAGVLLLAVVAALVIFLVPAGDSTPDSDGTTAPRPSSSPEPAPDADGIGCEAEPSDDRDVPEDLRWETVDGIAWPVSDTVGPTTTEDGFSACFEHSPVGAALAGVTYVYSQLEHSPQEVGEFYLAESPGRDAALSEVDANTPSLLRDQLQDNGMTIVGYKIEEYDGDRASIRLVLRVPGSATGFRGLPAPMQWVDGDWKVKLLDTGSTGQASDVTSGSFTYWTAADNG
ncbi:hypothetical protein F1C15_15875 (plasmid) [Frigoribacterium sp. NBH87]|uniref:hypothetical protein n=1 Tax=Frigoribacterium sp. NBH87 TaxID=2596916 RepID=UPI00162A0334|nr:hypothetical protein [Frigoribacterium sp. NBH87]QNE45449.1 hypothetical protein F1C15_15875 [Frigoribacterium sp. NBH87]